MEPPSTEQIQALVNKHFATGNSSYILSNVIPAETQSYSFVPNMRIYLLDLKLDNVSYLSFLCLAQSTSTASPYNSLATVASLIDIIRTTTPLPLSPPTVDYTLSSIPYEYLISEPAKNSASALIPLSEAKSKLNLSDKEAAVVDLKIGQFLGQLHKLVQNDWFGKPSITPPPDPSYSWQESFTSLFDGALHRALDALSSSASSSSSSAVSIPLEEINRCMSRAIAFFLFDDVEVPSLIWFTGSPQDVYLVLKPLPDGTQSLELAAILPSLGQAVWGDPLLETFFLDPSEGLMEGYVGGGGAPLTVFPRQRTKRIWYTLYLALIVLAEHESRDDSKRQWALEKVKTCVEQLKEAPCY